MDAIFWYGPGLNFLRIFECHTRRRLGIINLNCTILSSDKGLFFHYVSQIFQFLEPFPPPLLNATLLHIKTTNLRA